MSLDTSQMELQTVDLRSLIGHSESVQATSTVETTQALFAAKSLDFVAVAEGHELVGVCARRDLSLQLSSRYGFAIFARKPITALLLATSLKVKRGTPITDVFEAASARNGPELFDDVVLVDERGRYLGMIPMRTLVRLQTQFLRQHNAQLEASRAEIVAKNRATDEDLAMAREVQLALLPPLQASIHSGERAFAVAHRYRAASGISGDFFEVMRVSENATGVLVCDVMGHGVRSALITAMVRAMLEELRPIARDPAAFLTRLNHDLTRILRRASGVIFVTAGYMVIDFVLGQVRYAQAGHPAPLQWNPRLAQWTPFVCPPAAQGPALGLLDDFNYENCEEKFEVGARWALFTDGLFEAADSVGEEFGPERLTAALNQAGRLDLENLLDDVLAKVAAFSGGTFVDDICFVAMEVTAQPVVATTSR